VRLYVTSSSAVQRTQTVQQFKAEALKHILPHLRTALSAVTGEESDVINNGSRDSNDPDMSTAMISSTVKSTPVDPDSFTAINSTFLTLIINKTILLIQ